MIRPRYDNLRQHCGEARVFAQVMSDACAVLEVVDKYAAFGDELQKELSGRALAELDYNIGLPIDHIDDLMVQLTMYARDNPQVEAVRQRIESGRRQLGTIARMSDTPS